MRVKVLAPPILLLESIASDVFDEGTIKARMDVIKNDREDVLVQMRNMLTDYDVSVVDALCYASRFGLPFEKDW